MSYSRKTGDKKKVNNFVAKHDFNKGGFHGKTEKAERKNYRQKLNKINPEEFLEDYE